jgi:hypothetical protein
MNVHGISALAWSARRSTALPALCRRQWHCQRGPSATCGGACPDPRARAVALGFAALFRSRVRAFCAAYATACLSGMARLPPSAVRLRLAAGLLKIERIAEIGLCGITSGQRGKSETLLDRLQDRGGIVDRMIDKAALGIG